MYTDFDLKTEILKEHSNRQAQTIARWALAEQQNFDMLLHVFIHENYRITQRAAYAIMKCFDFEPARFQSHLVMLFKHSKTENKHIAVKRNIFRMFETAPIPTEIEDELLNTCFDFLDDKKEVDAIRCSSIIVAHRIAVKYPEILSELNPDYALEKAKGYSKTFE